MQQGVLTLKQQEVFKELKKFPDFYMVGGTALALQIGHRKSVDFDLFGEKPLDKAFFAKVYRVFKPHNLEVDFRHSEQTNIKTEGVKVHFVKYKYPLLFKLKKIEEVQFASIEEIALMKAFAMGQRATLKDYVDLYFIIKEGFCSLDKIIDYSEKKYGSEFSGGLFLEQLTFLEDVREIEEMPIDFLAEKVNRIQMKEFFEHEISKIKL